MHNTISQLHALRRFPYAVSGIAKKWSALLYPDRRGIPHGPLQGDGELPCVLGGAHRGWGVRSDNRGRIRRGRNKKCSAKTGSDPYPKDGRAKSSGHGKIPCPEL